MDFALCLLLFLDSLLRAEYLSYTMKTYYITYISKTDGDCCTVWTEAMSREDAVDNIESEYWDVDEIIGIREER